MKFKKMILLCLLFVLCYNMSASADNAEIIADVSISNGGIYASGTITGVEYPCSMLIMVFEDEKDYTPDNLKCIGSASTDEEGNFEITCSLEGIPYGQYAYFLGSDKDKAVITGTLNYNNIQNFMNADITIEVDNYIPTINGTINCIEGKAVQFNVLNVTDNIIIANDIIENDDGMFNVSYQLPSLTNSKVYSITITASDGIQNHTVMNIEIDTSLIMVEVTGNITVSEDAMLDFQAQSVGTDLININKSVTQSESFSTTLPNILSDFELNMALQGYEIVNAEDTTIENSYQINGITNEEFKLMAMIDNLDSFNDNTFILEYEPAQIEPVSLFGLEYGNIVGTGKLGNVNILNFENGRITFKIENVQISQDKLWEGVLNIFKFRFKQDTSTTITLKM